MTEFAAVFPGQGSQSVGMLASLAEHYPLINQVFTQASAVVDYDIWQLEQTGPEEKLNQTELTQVAMLTADVAMYRVLRRQGLQAPQLLAGHSLGEYAALVCAESLSLTDAVKVVAKRGQLMQKAIPLGQGAMAAIIGLSDEQVNKLCKEASSLTTVVAIANYNTVGQVVIAGHTLAVEQVVHMATTEGARLAKFIPVSVPCHCALLKDAATEFANFLETISFDLPQIPVISNVDLSMYQEDVQIRMLLTEQLFRPVQWVKTINLIKNKGVLTFVECGPGKVLSGLIKRIDRQLLTFSTPDLNSLQQVLAHF